MDDAIKAPNLPARFLEPAGWQTGSFINDETGHKIHFGKASPQNPKATIVLLQGLSEFTEKYFEIANDMLARGYAVWAMDWAYQGQSSRLKNHSDRRHSDGFESDLSDLHKFITEYVIPNSNATPLVMLGHSMGGHLGLRFLARYPGIFKAAIFSAPFLGIYNFTPLLQLVATTIKPFCRWIGQNYVFGGTDWHEAMRKSDGKHKFTTDPVRDAVHNSWCLLNPQLRVGSITFGWVIEALKSCAYLQQDGILSSIKIPVTMAMAGKEQIVDNAALHSSVQKIPQSQLLSLPEACHEILMERDESRGRFLAAFDDLMKKI